LTQISVRLEYPPVSSFDCSDNTHTAAINQMKLLQKLTAFLPSFAGRIREVVAAARRPGGDPILAERLEETRDNLRGFLDYKPKFV